MDCVKEFCMWYISKTSNISTVWREESCIMMIFYCYDDGCLTLSGSLRVTIENQEIAAVCSSWHQERFVVCVQKGWEHMYKLKVDGHVEVFQ